MNENAKDDRWGGIVGGVILVALGLSFLLAQLDLGSWKLWYAWPIVLIALGALKFAWGRTWRRRKTGVILFGIGLWLWATRDGWGGLTWRSSWPLLLILFGSLAVIEAVFGLKDEGDCS